MRKKIKHINRSNNGKVARCEICGAQSKFVPGICIKGEEFTYAEWIEKFKQQHEFCDIWKAWGKKHDPIR